jgi:biotin-dependent carboxylase-like uncharacterized protein
MSIVVTRPGLMTTVQDLGRWGHQALGVPVSGPMDTRSHRLANHLAGNTPRAATLETTLVGIGLTMRGRGRVAIAGCDCAVVIDGRTYDTPCVAVAEDGSRIDVGPCRRGARAYIAIEGGIATEVVLGSRATDIRSGLGGLNGRALHASDELPIGVERADPAKVDVARFSQGRVRVKRQYASRVPGHADRLRARHTVRLPHATEATRLRVVPGPQARGVFDALCTAPLTLTPRCDRVGYRFAADARLAVMEGDLVSQPTVMGSVQITPSGEAILLMADRQTTGGYAQAAVVISADLPVAGQLVPGSRVHFEPCTYDAARTAWLEEEESLGIAGAVE